MPAVWHWFGIFLAPPHKFVSLWSLPEGYIFAFLVSAASLTEAIFLDEWREAWANCFRVLVIGFSIIAAVLALTLYVAMLGDYPRVLESFQMYFALVVSGMNLTYMSFKISRTND